MSAVNAFYTRRKSGITSTPVALCAAGTRLAGKGIVVKADPNNSDTVWISDRSTLTGDSADATDGYPLGPGEREMIPIGDPSLLYVMAPTGTQKVWFGVV